MTLLPSLQRSLWLSTAAALALTACGQKAEPPKAPPPAVTVVVVSAQDIGGSREFVARTEAYSEVQLIARVEGTLEKKNFQEGGIVAKDQVLFEINQDTYKAQLSQAKAELAARIAEKDRSERDLKRGAELAPQGFISQSDLDKLTSNKQQADAAVLAAEAAVEAAEINLSYTRIVAPFAGQIGKSIYSVGNTVGPNKGTLATLVNIDKIKVNFQLEEASYTAYLQERAKSQATEKLYTLKLMLPNKTLHDALGELDFADTKVDATTGTVSLRAVFDNPDHTVLPGLYTTLLVESQIKETRALIPQAAVQENQQGTFVLVVDSEQKVAQRFAKLGQRFGAMWVVESGLEAGEQVIVEGLQKVRAGALVAPTVKVVDPKTGAVSESTAPAASQEG
ncbi:efflux RND transporter periplasmic adaptor subunit [Simiduia curdlanivorans]|uniref:Efflux RND transporter periplasmic adaptor subunit n=1 Tax=Simiduia curdlanivorans TaxID=1492769 RepID=A0ABV8V467_9GAMM|nr:efflux RND transporter periplasmic adaptor subunit [Simiduia curdlanivorans]MDN3637308.1 efflux RND transporter periplasmic adaptor subunit [Simiduia curdlanivorans]